MTPQREEFKPPTLLQQFEKALAELAEASRVADALSREVLETRNKEHRAVCARVEAGERVDLLSAELTKQAARGGK